MKITLFLSAFLLGLSSPKISIIVGVDFLIFSLVLGLMGPVFIIHKAAFRAHKYGLFDPFSNIKKLAMELFTNNEIIAVIAFVSLFLGGCVSVFL